MAFTPSKIHYLLTKAVAQAVQPAEPRVVSAFLLS